MRAWEESSTCPFSLRSEFHLTLARLATLPWLASLSNCRLGVGSQGDGHPVPSSTVGRSLSLPVCSSCPWCPILLITRAHCKVDSYSQRRSPGPSVQSSWRPVPCALSSSPSRLWTGMAEGLWCPLDSGSATLPLAVRAALLHRV